jgi:hypothetical protein
VNSWIEDAEGKGGKLTTNKKRFLVLGTVVLIMLGGWCFNTISVLAEAQGTEDSYINVSAGRKVGIGGCLFHGAFGFAVKVWSTETTALSACFLVPPTGGTPSFMVRALRKIIDTSYLDGYIALGGQVPITEHPNWQRIDGSVGIEWSFPDIPEFAFTMETGICMVHYYSYGAWRWRSETFMGMEIDFYF